MHRYSSVVKDATNDQLKSWNHPPTSHHRFVFFLNQKNTDENKTKLGKVFTWRLYKTFPNLVKHWFMCVRLRTVFRPCNPCCRVMMWKTFDHKLTFLMDCYLRLNDPANSSSEDQSHPFVRWSVCWHLVRLKLYKHIVFSLRMFTIIVRLHTTHTFT